MVDQFTRLREGDRFFYLNDADLLSTEVTSVIDLNSWRLSDIIMANTGMTGMRANAFVIPEPSSWVLLVIGGLGIVWWRRRGA